MTANFENGFFGNNQPFWHGQGTVIMEDGIPFSRVVELVPEIGMEVREVETWANLGDGKGFKVPDQKVRVRSDGAYLGAVGDGNVLIQNEQAWLFMQDLMPRLMVHTAGTLNKGRQSWLQCRRPENIRIAGLADEEHECFLTTLNSFDGSLPVQIITGTTRVGCWNTYNASIDEAKAKFIFKHTSELVNHLAQAKHVLGIADRFWDKYQLLGTKAIQTKFSDKQFMATLDELVPLPSLFKLDYDAETDKRKESNAEAERDAVKLIWTASPSLQNCRNTAWAAIQTYTEFIDHHTNSRETKVSDQAENRMKRIMFDTSLREKATTIVRREAELVSLS